MSTIIAKAFDATKKIVRTVFKGAPNLFTTSDLNRQLEAFKYQMDALQRLLPVKGRFTITPSVTATEGGMTCSLDVSHTGSVEVAGASFSGLTALHWSQGVTATGYPVYVVIKATKRELSFTDDPDHNIVGAKFTDGTSKSAANQIVYENPQFEVIPGGNSAIDNESILGIIALVWYNKNGSNVSTNVIDNSVRYQAPLFGNGQTIRKNQYTGRNDIDDGVSFSEAIYTLQNRLAYEETSRADGDNTLAALIGNICPAVKTGIFGDYYSMYHYNLGTWRAHRIGKMVFVYVWIPAQYIYSTFFRLNGGTLKFHGLIDEYPMAANQIFPVQVALTGLVSTGGRELTLKDCTKTGYVEVAPDVAHDFKNEICVRDIPYTYLEELRVSTTTTGSLSFAFQYEVQESEE